MGVGRAAGDRGGRSRLRRRGDRGRGSMAESAPAHPGDRPLGQGAGVLMKSGVPTGRPGGALLWCLVVFVSPAGGADRDTIFFRWLSLAPVWNIEPEGLFGLFIDPVKNPTLSTAHTN